MVETLIGNHSFTIFMHLTTAPRVYFQIPKGFGVKRHGAYGALNGVRSLFQHLLVLTRLTSGPPH